ncbi:MAG: LacI family DNA-binding transcriptional regulator [Armatimonadota bacterium]|nr:LacI family DNA-binding transcriptional regulator [Armatimonadota bacterium]MDW8290992.1 LacI family DNA-binding transcriptional regulator [Armatimonadota bacterium]
MARVDIAYIARELGVSVSTVHRALHNTGRISEATRQRVLETAQRLGYRPNLVARALRSQNTRTLGVVVTGISSSFYARMLDGIESAAREAGYSVLLASSHDDAGREQEQIEVLLEKQAEALLVAPASPRQSAEYYRSLVAEGFRLVFLGRHVAGVPTLSVETDNVTGGYLVGQHLCALGRRRLAVLTTVPAKRGYSYVQERITGFQNALQEVGRGRAPVLGEDIHDFPLSLPEFAHLVVQSYLKQGGEVDALFAINDDLAFGAIGALLDMGVRVPEQVAVVGFNDEWMSPYFRPALTTVRSEPQRIGREAVRLVVQSIERGEPVPSQRILVEPALVIRQSCGARVNTTTDL